MPDCLDREIARAVECAGIWRIVSRLPKSLQIAATILTLFCLGYRAKDKIRGFETNGDRENGSRRFVPEIRQ